jgi:hypothetical protein
MQDDYKIIVDVSEALEEITDQEREALSELLVLQEWGVDIKPRLEDILAKRPNVIEPAK